MDCTRRRHLLRVGHSRRGSANGGACDGSAADQRAVVSVLHLFHGGSHEAQRVAARGACNSCLRQFARSCERYAMRDSHLIERNHAMQPLCLFADWIRTLDAKALAVASLFVCPAPATFAAEEAPPPPPPGFPPGLDWKFNFDASWGAFGFGNSLYTNPKPDDDSGNLSDNWFEGSIKVGISGEYKLANSSQIYGKLSGVGERTYGASPSLVGGDQSSFKEEDLYLGWRSGNMLSQFGENALDFVVGRTQYKLGHGLLLWDGSAEGGSRGGYWTNVRKAFEFAAIGRFKPGNHTIEAFYLRKDELPESNTDSKLWGVNYEYAFGEDTTVGATYMKWDANQ